MSQSLQLSSDPGVLVLTDAQMRRSVWVTTYMTLLLPPLVGGTLMGVADYYPLPEFYLVFLSYTGVYVLAVLAAATVFARRFANHLIAVGHADEQAAQLQSRRLFRRLPWWLIGLTTLYSVFGALTADYSLESLGYRTYDLRGHLNNQFGLVPVVLITVFPIFFYFTDQLGRYFGPRGVHEVMVPMGFKLVLLGIVTPLLIDSLLVGYFINQSGYVSTRMLLLWFGLLALAVGGTWLAWRSMCQGLRPLQRVLLGQDGVLDEASVSALKPLSIDEFGMLTHRMARQLAQQHQLSSDLRRAEALSQAILEHAGTLVVVLDRGGRMVRFNEAAERLSGYSTEEMLGKFPWDTVLPPEQAKTVRKMAFEALAHNPQALAGRFTNEWVGCDGARYLIDWFNTLLLDEQGEMDFMVSVGVDITQRHHMEAALRESESKYRRLHESMTDAYVMVNMKGRLLEWNRAYESLLGYSAEELASKSIRDLTPEKWHAQEAQIVKQQVLLRGYSDVYEKEYVRQDGEVLSVDLRTYLLRDDNGEPAGMWAIVRDISERKAAEARIASLAYLDPLTSLPNRALFFDRMQHALLHARRENQRVALLFVDLDKFKPVNDTYGHAVGDKLLLAISDLLRQCVRESDTVGRIGGDEFVVLLPEIASSEDALAVAEKIQHALRQPVAVGAYLLEVSSSIGVALFPEHGRDDVQLMKSADDAMYRAKDAGRDRVLLAQHGTS